ncbi:disulfide bond formation protein DsbB [Marinimicrobium koreense]|uniref:Disulfide bond formation protein B n=2 Tax=Marinimicrobium TaxID=359337 RepID=A0A3N1NQ54_9GAMM|nr:disulfide bond formation protein B [Marinimicrobium koreense]ROQ18009.1 disulfide bond formation protein DsbB [Marinimicrobium koreense]
MPLTIRMTNLLIVLAVVAMMAVALYMEHAMGLEPCPLCVSQRIFVILVGVWALLAFLHHPGRIGRGIYAGLGVLSAVAGGAVSSRQLWLQSLPASEVPACGPGVDYILDTFPLLDALRVMLTGDGNCAEVAWSLFGISIPGWTLIGFILLGLAHLWQALRRR